MHTIDELNWLTTGELRELQERIDKLLTVRDPSNPGLPLELNQIGYEGTLLVGQN